MFNNIYKFIPIIEGKEILSYIENIYILLLLFFCSYIILKIVYFFTLNKKNILK